MNSQSKQMSKRKLLSSMVSDMAQTLRDSQSIHQVKEMLEKQLQAYQVQPFTALSKDDPVDQLQGRATSQLCTNLCAQSPWFGSTEKRLTGLGAATLFVPVTASTLAQRHQPFTMQQRLERVSQQTSVLREQLQRKLDRMTGVRAKADEWETVFPEDE